MTALIIVLLVCVYMLIGFPVMYPETDPDLIGISILAGFFGGMITFFTIIGLTIARRTKQNDLMEMKARSEIKIKEGLALGDPKKKKKSET